MRVLVSIPLLFAVGSLGSSGVTRARGPSASSIIQPRRPIRSPRSIQASLFRHSTPSTGLSMPSSSMCPRIRRSVNMGASVGPADADSKEVGLARVGPNTLIQTVGALKEKYGEEKASKLLKTAGFGYLASDLPTSMVQEMNFHNLVKGLKPQIGEEELADVLFNAGAGTAEYLLRVRIPGFFQELVKILPQKPALQLLLFAIGKAGAWTFRGSGEYYTEDVKDGIDIHVSVVYPSLPLVSNFYRGVFDYLIHTLVDPNLPVVPDTNVNGEYIDCNIQCKLN